MTEIGCCLLHVVRDVACCGADAYLVVVAGIREDACDGRRHFVGIEGGGEFLSAVVVKVGCCGISAVTVECLNAYLIDTWLESCDGLVKVEVLVEELSIGV